MPPSGISRRIEHCIESYCKRDYESSLVNLFPAIDKTASRRRPKTGVGTRIRAYLKDEMRVITAIGSGIMIGNIRINGFSLEEALYKFGRTSVMHEGEIDARLSFIDNGMILVNENDWRLPSTFILGMAISVIISPENQDEELPPDICADIYGERFILNDCWGNPKKIHALLGAQFPGGDWG